MRIAIFKFPNSQIKNVIPETKNLLLYIAKCVTGCIVIFLLSWLFNYPDITWIIISVMLVLTPESKEAIPLAITRIKSNLIAGVTSLLCLLFFPATAITIIIVIVITILICYRLNIMTGSRSAIAAVIIIMLHGMQYDQLNFWTVTLQRIGSVVVGCILGLVITLLFHRNFLKKSFSQEKPDEA